MSYASPQTEEERKIAKIMDDSYSTGWDEAIEECARVAEDRRWGIHTPLETIAAAIRALKDKP